MVLNRKYLGYDPYIGHRDAQRGWEVFFGESEHTLDDKNRVSLPIRHREELGETVMIGRGTRGQINVLPVGLWKEMVNRAQQASQDRSDIDDTVRFLFSYNEAELDRQGRMVIPALLRRQRRVIRRHGGFGQWRSGRDLEPGEVARQGSQNRQCQACPGNRRRSDEAAGAGSESMSMEHTPVLLTQVIDGLILRPSAICIDATLGGGGHAEAILGVIGSQGRLLGLDADPEALSRVQTRLARFAGQTTLVQANFRDIGAVARANGFTAVDAILMDLGVSSYQLWGAERGFSFTASGPLDMRMDPHLELTADEIVNIWPQDELADIIYRYGEEPRSRRIARAIVAARPLHTTAELAEVIVKAASDRNDRSRIHPATRSFQALRIAVNDELGALEEALPQALALLVSGGRLAVITFHSLEDRPVKQFMQREARDCVVPPGPASVPVWASGAVTDQDSQTDSAGRGRDRGQPTQPERKTSDCRAAVALTVQKSGCQPPLAPARIVQPDAPRRSCTR